MIKEKIDLRNPTVMLPNLREVEINQQIETRETRIQRELRSLIVMLADLREVVINQETEIQRDLNAKMSNLKETETTSPIEETRTSHREALHEIQ